MRQGHEDSKREMRHVLADFPAVCVAIVAVLLKLVGWMTPVNMILFENTTKRVPSASERGCDVAPVRRTRPR